MSAQPIERAPKHPECNHPVVNGSDDFSGVVCCCCDGSPCPAVSIKQLAEHVAFSRHVLGIEENRHRYEEQEGTDDCKHCGMPDVPGLHFDTRTDAPVPDTADWQAGDIVGSDNGGVFEVQATRDGRRLVFVPMLPLREAQGPPAGAVLLMRDGKAVA